MWLKTVFIVTFILLLFLLSRLMDIAINGYQLNSWSLLPSHLFLNPVDFSVRQLKRLLDIRGVSHAGLLEKSELIDLIEASGGVSEEQFMQINEEDDGDMMIDQDSEETYKSETRFTCGSHFYEEVEDTKDSAWLVNVIPLSGIGIDPHLWRKIVKKSDKFGIRTGVFECAKDPHLCDRKQWISPRIVLALPREGLKMKEDVAILTYFFSINTKEQHIMNWIHHQLASRVSKINSLEELNQNWLKTDDEDNDVKFVFISSLATPPLILSALAIKFSGRIKFGMFKTDTKKKKSIVSKLEKRIPSYIIVLPDAHYNYGQNPGENINYRSMELLLRSLKPEMNDIFLLSLFLINLSVGLHFFWMKCSKLWKHIIYWLMHVIKCNSILFLLWLTIMTLNRFPFMETFNMYGYRLCRYIATSQITMILRYDVQYYYKIPLLLITFVSLGLVLGIVRRKYVSSSVDDNDDQLLFRDWVPLESTLLSYILFRPIGMTGFRSMTSSIDLNLEEGMELLIERLAMPNLWLQTQLIPTDYIQDLPVWVHRQENESELSESDDGTLVYESGNELNGHSEAESRSHNHDTNNGTSSELTHNSSHGSNDHLECDCTSSIAVNKGPLNMKQCAHLVQHQTLSRHRSFSKKKSNQLHHHKPDPQRQDQVPQGMIICSECAICLEAYRKGQSICGLPCGHNYHQNCIIAWLYRDNHCCPTCRWPTYKQRPKMM